MNTISHLETLKRLQRRLEEDQALLRDAATEPMRGVWHSLCEAHQRVTDLLPDIEASTAYVVDSGAAVWIVEAITGRQLSEQRMYVDDAQRQCAVADLATIVHHETGHQILDQGRVVI